MKAFIWTPVRFFHGLLANVRYNACTLFYAMPLVGMYYDQRNYVSVCLSVCLFLANVLRYVRYMLSAVRLLSVCCLSVTLVHPTQAVELFGNFFFTIR